MECAIESTLPGRKGGFLLYFDVYSKKQFIFAEEIGSCYASGGSDHSSPSLYAGVLYLEDVVGVLVCVIVVPMDSQSG